ncbi:MAG TPA: HD domain-containing phosphohydrolase [Vicinamibacterales bacterium]
MHHRPTVLLVHDDLDARLRFGNWLSAGGYRCLTVDDSASALRFAGRTSPDVAVIDISRRDRDRLWLASRLRDRATPIGVVFTSGSTSHEHLDALRFGASGVVVGPRGPEELLDAVQRAASQRDVDEARALDVHQNLMASVAGRHAAFKRIVAASPGAVDIFSAVRETFRRGEPALLGHSVRVTRQSVALARAHHLSPSAVADIQGAALLHDFGKLSLPEAVLLGDLPVGDADMEALLDHHCRTLDALSGKPALAGVAALLESVFEWWDGRGYPVGLAGRDIPLGARIIAVADTFDAARVHYPAGDTWAHHEAGRAAIARGAGSRLDPDLVRVYLHLLDGESCS